MHMDVLAPAGVIDTGDCKDHYGPSTGNELDEYEARVLEVVPWAGVNPGTNAQWPILPGNHDEVNDYPYQPANDFSLFNARLWGPPYHWTCDWQAAQVRFIGYHARIVHWGDTLPYSGFFVVEQAERNWLASELGLLPDGWQAIVCSHPPLHPSFGNNIGEWPGYGGTEVKAILAQHSGRIAAYLNGHRHANMNTAVLNGITHFNGPGTSYSAGNGKGGFVPIDYNPPARTLTFRYHYARTPFAPFVGYTPVVIQLPSLPNVSSYTFETVTTLQGTGPLSGRNVTISGTLDAEDETPTGTTCAIELTE
jgi:hypothetical protein